MSNTVEWINSRTTKAEEWISNLEVRMVEITAAKEIIVTRLKIKKKKKEDNLSYGTTLHTSIYVIGVPEGDKRQDLRKYLKRW